MRHRANIYMMLDERWIGKVYSVKTHAFGLSLYRWAAVSHQGTGYTGLHSRIKLCYRWDKVQILKVLGREVDSQVKAAGPLLTLAYKGPRKILETFPILCLSNKLETSRCKKKINNLIQITTLLFIKTKTLMLWKLSNSDSVSSRDLVSLDQTT